jgi:hypothetical protein
MIPLSPALVVAAANAFVGLGEDRGSGGDNRGQMVELFLREVKQPPGQPWCAALVYHVGYWSHFDHRAGKSSWPLPATASCWELGDFAKRKKILKARPAEGDVFLLHSVRLKRFHHTGVVISVDECLTDGRYACTTVEGNTNADGSANGYTTLRRVRRLGGEDRFIRWANLDGRMKAVGAEGAA